MAVRFDLKISKSVHQLAERIAIKELEGNVKELEILYKEILDALLKDGIEKRKISLYGMQLIINKKRKLVTIKDVECKIDDSKISGLYGKVSLAEGYIDTLDQRKNHNTDYDYKAENQEYIKLIEDTILFFQKSALPKLKKNHFTSLIDGNESKLALRDWRGQLKIAQSYFEFKVKVPVNTQHILLHCIATMASHNDAAKEFFRQRMSVYNIIGKQLIKYRRGAIKGIPAIYKPQNRDQSMMWGYLGVQCACKSWRVIEFDSFNFKSECLDCDVINPINHPIKCNNCTILFYEEHIKELKDITKCPHCNEQFTPITLRNIEAQLEVTQ